MCSKVLILIPRDENGVTSCIETENYFFNTNIYLNRTEGFADDRTGGNTRGIRSQSSQSK